MGRGGLLPDGRGDDRRATDLPYGELAIAMGPLTYGLADFLYGPVWAASLVTAVVRASRTHWREALQRRMTLSLSAAVLAAGAMGVAVACIRSANRHYHIDPSRAEFAEFATVLVVWTTLLAGLTAAGWHFWAGRLC